MEILYHIQKFIIIITTIIATKKKNILNNKFKKSELKIVLFQFY